MAQFEPVRGPSEFRFNRRVELIEVRHDRLTRLAGVLVAYERVACDAVQQASKMENTRRVFGWPGADPAHLSRRLAFGLEQRRAGHQDALELDCRSDRNRQYTRLVALS